MARFIIKIVDPITSKTYYLEYSTIVDAPVTYGMELQKFKQWYIEQYGTSQELELNERLKRVEINGCSGHYPFDSLESILIVKEEEILRKYCLKRKKK